MAIYTYEAMNKQGAVLTGTISAADEYTAINNLAGNGFVILEINQEKPEKQKTALFGKKKVKAAELSLFSRQLAVMIGAGVPITQAINSLYEQTENPLLTQALKDISDSIKGGSGIVEAFSAHKNIFPPIYLSMLGAGEIGGMMEESLTRLAVQLQKEKQLNDNIKSATSYPKMVGGFSLVMFFGMLAFVVPVFEGFLPANADIPALTQVSFTMSHSLRNYWYIWITGVLGLIVALQKFAVSKVGKNIWENHKLTLPLFGSIIQKTVIARFARTLATLLQGGIPIVQALQSAGPTSGSQLIAQAVEEAIEKIKAGRTVAQTLGESKLFPPMVINMIAIGEEAGTVTELLDKVAEFYEEDVQTATKSLSSIIEPIMLIFVGLIVGGMLLSLYLPIFTSVVA